MSADVSGYSRLMAEDEVATLHTLTSHREAIDTLISKHDGRIVDAPGDNVLAEFPSALGAVRCGIEIQHELKARTLGLALNRRMELRIGIQLGDVMVEGDQIYGNGVNVAARLEGLAEVGGICISGTVFEQVHNKLEVEFEDLGPRSVKNIPEPVRVYRIKLESSSAVQPAKSSARPNSALTLGVAAFLFVLIATAAAVKLLTSGSSGSPTPRQTRSLAVLPLANFSGDPNQEYFADGMTDELITDLANIGGLAVISRTSVMQYKGEHKETLPEIAKALNVSTVLEGSVMRVGDQVRITVQLIDAPTDKHLWAKSYESESRDVLKLQANLASEIARQIKVELTPEERARLADVQSVNPEAHEAYLKGLYYIDQSDPNALLSAQKFFERAIELDPNFAPAYAGLAQVYILVALAGPPSEAMPLARAAAQKALELDDNLAEAHCSLATIRFQHDFDWVGSEREFRRALELNPSYALAHSQYGFSLALQRRFDDGLIEMERGRQLDPLSVQNTILLALGLTWKGDFDAAKEQLGKALNLNPTSFGLHLGLGLIDVEAGKFNDAIPELITASEDQHATFQRGFLGYAYAAAGQRDSAQKMLGQLKALATQEYVSPFAVAQIYLGLGDRDRALEWLEKAYKAHSPWILTLVVSKTFDSVREDPRFAALVGKLGLHEITSDSHSATSPN